MKKTLTLLLLALASYASAASTATFTRTVSPTITKTRTPTFSATTTRTSTRTITTTRTITPSVTPTGGISGVAYDTSLPGQVRVVWTGVNLNPGPLDQAYVRYGPNSSYQYTNGAVRTLTPGTGYASTIPNPGPFNFNPRVRTTLGLFDGGYWLAPGPSTATPTRTTTITLTWTESATKTSTATKTNTPAATLTFTLLPTPIPATVTSTRTPTTTRTATRTSTFTITPSSTPTRTATTTKTATATATVTPTNTPVTFADWRFENNLNDNGPSALTLTASGVPSYTTGVAACVGTRAMVCTAGYAVGNATLYTAFNTLAAQSRTITIDFYTGASIAGTQSIAGKSPGAGWFVYLSGGQLTYFSDLGGQYGMTVAPLTCYQLKIVSVAPSTETTYLNGVQQGSTTFSGFPTFAGISDFAIGGDNGGFSVSFLGTIGNFKITTP